MKLVMRTLAVMALVAVAIPSLAKEGEAGARNKNFSGEVTKIELDKIVLVSKGDGGETSETFTVNDSTKVWLPGDPATATGGGEGKKMIKPKAGKIEDVKVGDRARVEYNADKVAVAIYVSVPPAPKVGGEGGAKEPAAPKVNKEGGERKEGGDATPRKREGGEH